MDKFTISTLLIFFSAILVVPSAIAQMEEPDDTRIEKYEDLNQTQDEPTTSESEMNSDSQMDDMEEMESEDSAVEPETRTEETLEENRSGDKSTSYDVRRTEAFNLVSSAYRGDFEDQGINSYAVLISNYESGELTAEDLIQAGIEAGELSPSAMDDQSYVDAVDSQLNALTTNS